MHYSEEKYLHIGVATVKFPYQNGVLSKATLHNAHELTINPDLFFQNDDKEKIEGARQIILKYTKLKSQRIDPFKHDFVI